MSADTYIYFIAPIGGGPIKIGWSRNPGLRLYTLMSWSPQKLELLATVPGTKYDKRAVQSAFADHWFHHEWFHSVREIHDLIAEVRATGVLPDRFKGTPDTKGLPHRNPKSWNAVIRARMAGTA